MAENQGQHRSWSQFLTPVTTILGFTDSTSDKRLPVSYPEPGDEGLDNINRTTTHRSLNASSECDREKPLTPGRSLDVNDTVRTSALLLTPVFAVG